MRRAVLLAAAAALLAQPLAAQPPSTATDVSPLTVTPQPLAPVPDVGEGAPLISPAEIREVSAKAKACVDTASALAMIYARMEVGPLSTKLDTIARAAELNEGRILSTEDAGGLVVNLLIVERLAPAAEAATLAAENARRNAAVVGPEAVAAAELARQTAVRRLQIARALLMEIRARAAEGQRWARAQPKAQGATPSDFVASFMPPYRDGLRRSAATSLGHPDVYADLGLSTVEVHSAKDDAGRPTLQVRGRIHNTRKREIVVPPLRMIAFDEKGSVLKSVVMQPERRTRLAAGADQAFAYAMVPAPLNAKSVIVSFGSYQSTISFNPDVRPGCEPAEGED